MAWQTIGRSSLLRPAADEIDAKYLIERLLREWVKGEGVWCESLVGGKARIRVATGSLQQEVNLREFELKSRLKEELGYQLNNIEVRQV